MTTNPSSITSDPPGAGSRLLPSDREAILRAAIIESWAPWPISEESLEAEIQRRHFEFRNRYLPWITSVLPLEGKKVLEIGGGTGSSTIALAERGAIVDSIDMSEKCQTAVAVRAELFGLGDRVSFHCLNATDISDLFAGHDFDLIIYTASLEHMTYVERIKTLKSAWTMLRSGSFLSVCDTPNRLWYRDSHTALQQFFHWIPDDVAIDYAARTPREGFNSAFAPDRPDRSTLLARHGRGVSYHDFEIAMDITISECDVAGEWQFRRALLPEWAKAWEALPDGRFHRFLADVAPHIPLAFFEENLDLMIRKP